ncbi:hypothetical protein AXK11_05925 [Cephaloticoccus primus]|uniref:Amidohydrolase-related domain-containing protein n=1 Tax=Cephaloticoccus primus TaxID=1548207 RepID=A0A139SM22_9BACT|nr:amidohydrolase family protein [Cephaloticoccus primus]KXU35530.1 hypothetical protein AXK11_05925 [Cephaloticoccus primus]
MIDMHVHLYPPEINADPAGWAARAGEPHWATLSTRRRKSGQPVQGFPSVEELLRAMDEAGVERSVLLGWYWERAENCRLQNRFYADCVYAHPDRISAFASVSPSAGEDAVLHELDWAREHGLCGVGELSPHSIGWACEDPILAAVLARAGDWGWPVNLHVTEPVSRDYPGKVETPLADFAQLAAAHPHTPLILAHWGGRLPLLLGGAAGADTAAYVEDGGAAVDFALPQNLYFDTAASPLIYGPDIWQKFVARVGAERVLFGSDYPLNLYPALSAEPDIARFAAELRERSGLTAEEICVISTDNARRLLGRL